MRISDWSSDVCSSDLVGAIEAGDSPVPACRRDPVIGLVAASLTMIGIDIVTGRSPHGLAAGIEKAEPDRNIIGVGAKRVPRRSEEHTSELQSLMRISYAVFCLKKKKKHKI